VKISVLTAAFNPGPALRDCLDSVAVQKLPESVAVEHLVLDGGSTDGTVTVLEQWAREGPGRAFRSEPDDGFYSALNSGIPLAQGDIVGILNADDFYFDDKALARVAGAFADPEVQGVYGDLIYVKGGIRKSEVGSRKSEGGGSSEVGSRKSEGGGSSEVGSRESEGGGSSEGVACWRGAGDRPELQIKRYWRSGDFRRSGFWWGWMPPHPTVFVRREVYARLGYFRTDLGSAADYEWMVRVMVRHHVPFRYIPHVQVAMREGGMSNRSLAARLAANRNDRKAWSENDLTPLPWTLLMKPLRKLPQWFARLRRE